MAGAWAREVAANDRWMRDQREELHRHPELAHQERATRDRVVGLLREMGAEPRVLPGLTGVLATLGADRPGPAVALRADMDGLPIQETTGSSFASRSDGVMHACGHDIHMAALLGAARVMAARPERLRGPVRLIFQPAEEEGRVGGAAPMIARGALRGEPPVRAVLGQHVEPGLPVGTVGVRPGPLLAAGDEFRVTVHGHGGHASRPHLGPDAILSAAEIIVGLQSLVSRARDPVEPAVISVGLVHGGEKSNILPERVELAGTVRTFSPELRARYARELPRRVRHLAKSSGARASVRYTFGYPAVVNDPVVTEMVASGLRARAPGLSVRTLEQPVLGSEDFSRYLERVPGTFWFLGTTARGRPAGSLHSPTYLPDERALRYGAEALLVATEAVQRGLS
jgi:amidohydrolase